MMVPSRRRHVEREDDFPADLISGDEAIDLVVDAVAVGSKSVRKLTKKILKKRACHLFRHAMATTMIELGADVRILQEMLGHSSTHPAGKLGRTVRTPDGQAAGGDARELLEDLADEALEEAEPITPTPGVS